LGERSWPEFSTAGHGDEAWAKQLGMIETRGLVALIEASDAMVKAAKVHTGRLEKIGRLRYAMVRGDVSCGEGRNR